MADLYKNRIIIKNLIVRLGSCSYNHIIYLEGASHVEIISGNFFYNFLPVKKEVSNLFYFKSSWINVPITILIDDSIVMFNIAQKGVVLCIEETFESLSPSKSIYYRLKFSKRTSGLDRGYNFAE